MGYDFHFLTKICNIIQTLCINKFFIFMQKLNRKLVHITIGMVYLLFWPLFRWISSRTTMSMLIIILVFSTNVLCSSERYAPFLAALAPGISIIRLLLLGLGITKNESLVKSTTMSRSGDHRFHTNICLLFVICYTFPFFLFDILLLFLSTWYQLLLATALGHQSL
jgi:hypothetical protein